MAIAYDAVSTSTGAGSTSNFSWTHTPVGTPRGVVVIVLQDGGTLETVSCTYGGVAMTALTPISGAAASEPGYVYPFFLGTGIGTGAKTVAVTKSASQLQGADAWTVTAAADTEVEGSNSLVSSSQDDPSFTITTGASVETMAFAALFSGLGADGNITAGSGWTKDTGKSTTGDSMNWEHLTSNDAGSNITCAFVTTAADDVTMYGVAIKESAAAATFIPRIIMHMG